MTDHPTTETPDPRTMPGGYPALLRAIADQIGDVPTIHASYLPPEFGPRLRALAEALRRVRSWRNLYRPEHAPDCPWPLPEPCTCGASELEQILAALATRGAP